MGACFCKQKNDQAFMVTIRSVLGVYHFDAEHSTVGDVRQAFLKWAHKLADGRIRRLTDDDIDRIKRLAEYDIDRIEIESEQFCFGVVPDDTRFDSNYFKVYVLKSLGGDMDIVPVCGLRAVVHLKRGVLPCNRCVEPLCAEHDQTDVRIFDGFIRDVACGLVSNYLPEKAASAFCTMLNAATEGETDVPRKFRSLIDSYAAAATDGNAPVLREAAKWIQDARNRKRIKDKVLVRTKEGEELVGKELVRTKEGYIFGSVRDRGTDEHDIFIVQRFIFTLQFMTGHDLGPSTVARVEEVDLEGWRTYCDDTLKPIMEHVVTYENLYNAV